MSEQIKFTTEELEKVKSIQKEYVDIQNYMGQIQLSRIKLSQQLEGLNKQEEECSKKFINIQDEEVKFLDEIRKKYGDGKLDINTGIYSK